MKVQDWFLEKNYSPADRNCMRFAKPIIKRETANAYYLIFETEFKSICGWFPKSVCRKEAFDD